MSTIPSPHPGIFIVFEGITAAGKTTLAKRVVEELNKSDRHGYNEAVYVSELVGGTAYGDYIARPFLGSFGYPLDPMTEATCILGAKNELIKTIIRPHVSAGKIVICDRFSRSFMAFQGGMRELGYDLILQLLKLTKTDVVPDSEIFLTVNDEEQVKRRGTPRDHLERREFSDKRALMLGFFEEAKKHLPPYHSKTIDASDAFDEVLARVMTEVNRVLKFHRVSGQSFNLRHPVVSETFLESSPSEELIDPPIEGEIAA